MSDGKVYGVAKDTTSQDAIMDALRYTHYYSQVNQRSILSSGPIKVNEESLIILDEDIITKARKESERRIKVETEAIYKYELLKKQMSVIPFKIGDVAYHKEYGNVLIKGVSLRELSINGYAIITTKGEYVVEQNEILPINDTTRTLYGK